MERMTKNSYILTIWLCIIAIHSSFAAVNVRSRFLSSENGLQANYIRSIVQDSSGYIWMGSTTGLIRFDGYAAKLIVPGKSANRQMMLNERVLLVDLFQNRFIWLMVRGQKYCCYDTQTDSFVDYTGNGTYDESYRHYQILDNGELWLSDEKNGCKVIRFDGLHFTSEKLSLEKLPQGEKLPPPQAVREPRF